MRVRVRTSHFARRISERAADCLVRDLVSDVKRDEATRDVDNGCRGIG